MGQKLECEAPSKHTQTNGELNDQRNLLAVCLVAHFDNSNKYSRAIHLRGEGQVVPLLKGTGILVGKYKMKPLKETNLCIAAIFPFVNKRWHF